jgi:hypothetical protein
LLGYLVIRVASSLKAGVATLAALTALFGGVGVANAADLPGLGDPIPVPAVEDPVPAVEEAVAEATETAEQAVEDVQQTADEAVAAAPETADAAVAEVKEAVADTPVGNIISEVEPVVGDVKKTVGAVTQPAVPQLMTPSGPQTPATGADSPAIGGTTPGSTAFGAISTDPAAMLAQGSASPLLSAARLGEPAFAAGLIVPLADRSSAEQTAAGLLSAPFGELPAAMSGATRASNSDDGPSNAPWGPFAPFFPFGVAVTAAVVAGASGAALFAALLCAFMFMAPRTGRWLRPGPILVRPDPCLSLAELPG